MSSTNEYDRFGNYQDVHKKLTTLNEKVFEDAKYANKKFKRSINTKQIKLSRNRDELLTDFGRTTLSDRYLLSGEDFQELFARVSCAYADNVDHAQRVYDYISQLWFMPATPILTNGGSQRGLPISCFLNQVDDSLVGIMDNYQENLWLASNGGGIGTYWGNVRSVGESISRSGQTSGIIPFIRITDSFTLAISQGSLRRGNAAIYLDIHHPEIEEFLDLRKPSGDFNRKALNVHHAVIITDKFMKAVEYDQLFDLKSPKTGKTLRKVNARILWQKILETRLQTGEPFLIFIDTVNSFMNGYQKELGLKVNMSNLCSEILLPTGRDHLGNDRTAVCCLSSVNAETWDLWSKEPKFIEDIMRFLDNVLQDFIDRAPSVMSSARYSAIRERSVGLGLMGFHSLLMKKKVPFESVLAKSWNIKLFKHIRKEADKASYVLAIEKGSCPDAQERGIQSRFSNKLAVAPTASISIICGGTSACIEPIPANIYTHKTLDGSFPVKNKYLVKLLDSKGKNTSEVWNSILEQQGSVQHLDFLNSNEKLIFKTAFEIDQRWVVEMAGDRSGYICQGQSINLFLRPDIHKWDLMMLHRLAWKKNIKSLYYLRSQSVQRAQFAGVDIEGRKLEQQDYDECLACQ